MTRNFSEDITIRSATNRDKEKILGLVISVLPEYGLAFDIQTSEADLEDIEATYTNSGGFFAIVENDAGDLLGTFALLRLDEGTCKLRKMYLVPQSRGLGLGRLMLENAIETARELGADTVVLETVSVMTEAIRLYVRAGFRLVNQQATSPRCDQVYLLSLR